MEPRVELLDAAQGKAWRDALADLPHAFGHRPEYVAAAADVTGARAVLWTWRRGPARAVCPLLVRPIGGGGQGIDLVTPPGFAGLSSTGDCSDLGAEWTHWWRANDAVCAYVQAAPWAAGDAFASWHDADARRVPGADCLVWDLEPEPGALLAAMQPKHRQLLRKWLRESPGIVEDQALLRAAFPSLYAGFIARHAVSPAYRFDEAALRRVLDAPGTWLVGARGGDGELEAATLFVAADGRADSLLNAATFAGRRHSRGLYWLGALRLRERGIRELNLGGGVRDDDGLAAFKRRLGAVEVPTWTLRQVFDRPRFDAACGSAAVDPQGAWFPPWRARP